MTSSQYFGTILVQISPDNNELDIFEIQGDHLELSQKLWMITFKEKRICQAAILHYVDVFSPFDNNTPTSSNAS